MSAYNLVLIHGFDSVVLQNLLTQFLPVFILVLTLDLAIAAPFAKKFMMRIIRPTTKTSIILTISLSMIFMIVLLMSVFGSIMAKGFSIAALYIYPQTVLYNLIMAIPVNLAIAGPLPRLIHLKIFAANFN